MDGSDGWVHSKDVTPITNEDELQPMWAAMERRTINRPKPQPLTSTDSDSKNLDGSIRKSGRKNIKKTEEDYWYEAGAYGEVDPKDA